MNNSKEKNDKPISNEYITVMNSDIHRHGVFARKDIPKGTRVAEYIGIKITKEMGTMIETETFNKYKDDKKNNAATYIFEIDDEWDLDGDIPSNDPKFINHSCNPNCEVNIEDGKIWIDTIADIKKGDEITFNYGYEINEKDPYDFKHHPCWCGSKNCVGYILAEEQWPRIKELLEKENSRDKS